MQRTFLYISFQSLDDYDLKLPNFMFCGGLENKTTTFFSFPEIRYSPLELCSQLQKKLLTFDKFNEMESSDVFVVLAVVVS